MPFPLGPELCPSALPADPKALLVRLLCTRWYKPHPAPAHRQLLAHAWGRRAHVCRKVLGSSATPLTPLHPRAAAELGNLAPGSRGWVGARKNKEAGKRPGRDCRPDPRPLQMELLYVCMCLHARANPGILGMGVSLRLCVTLGLCRRSPSVLGTHLQGCG